MKNFYPDGYMPKIEYWTSKLNAEVMNTKVPDIQVFFQAIKHIKGITDILIKFFHMGCGILLHFFITLIECNKFVTCLLSV